MKFDSSNKPKGLKRVFLAMLNSFKAFKWLAQNEAAFKQELVLLIIAIPLTFLFPLSAYEQLALIFSIVFIMFAEVVNTAIEAVVDRISLDIHPLSGLAKDLGSAAVFISLVVALITWLVVLGPHLLALF